LVRGLLKLFKQGSPKFLYGFLENKKPALF